MPGEISPADSKANASLRGSGKYGDRRDVHRFFIDSAARKTVRPVCPHVPRSMREDVKKKHICTPLREAPSVVTCIQARILFVEGLCFSALERRIVQWRCQSPFDGPHLMVSRSCGARRRSVEKLRKPSVQLRMAITMASLCTSMPMYLRSRLMQLPPWGKVIRVNGYLSLKVTRYSPADLPIPPAVRQFLRINTRAAFHNALTAVQGF